jgi:hypothetical protein
MKNLSLQVAQVDAIGIDNCKRPDAGRCKVESGRRPQSTDPDQEHPRTLKSGLTFYANAGKLEVAAVSEHLLREEIRRRCIDCCRD